MKRKADGQQHLIEIAGAIELAIQEAFEHHAHQSRCQKGHRQRGKKRPAEAIDQRHGDVTAEHREGAMREVDEIHHAERDRQADRQQEQQHAVGKAVEQNADNWPEHIPPLDFSQHDVALLGLILSGQSWSSQVPLFPECNRETGFAGRLVLRDAQRCSAPQDEGGVTSTGRKALRKTTP